MCHGFVGRFKLLLSQGLSADAMLQLLLAFMTFRIQLAIWSFVWTHYEHATVHVRALRNMHDPAAQWINLFPALIIDAEIFAL